MPSSSARDLTLDDMAEVRRATRVGCGVIVGRLASDAGPPGALRALPAAGDLPPSDAK
jgi:hypothetical protein